MTAARVEPRTVAVVEDDRDTRKLLGLWIRAEGNGLADYDSARAVLAADFSRFGAVCLDLHLPGASGMEVLRAVRARDPELPVIVVTAERAVDAAVEAMRAGAYDYLVKPVDRGRLALSLRRALEKRALTERVRALSARAEGDVTADALVGTSGPMREVQRRIERVLDSDVTVCVQGESGTGKELVARAIHDRGRRKGGPFVAINCAAIPTSLQESELFGHEKGAFTGALTAREGRFEEARGGTLFLDEVGEMSPATQASLLRALQERTVRRLGGRDEIAIDARIVCATHRDLEEEVRAGRFRQDLYYRLVVYPIRVPPLRDRRDDLAALAAWFLRKLRSDVGREVTRVSPEALEALAAYNWPGNVRELENALHCAMLSARDGEVDLRDLPPAIRGARGSGPHSLAPIPPDAGPVEPDEQTVLPLYEVERRAIVRALRVSQGGVSRAAKLLGISRTTLYRKLAEYGLETG